MMENKIKKTITIPISCVEDMEKKAISPSRWFAENYKKIEMNKDVVINRIEETAEELEKLKNLAGVYEKQEAEEEEKKMQEFDELSEKKKEFFRETKKRLKMGFDLTPQYKLFCFEFGDIELKKFKDYVEIFGEDVSIHLTPSKINIDNLLINKKNDTTP
jgi:hypothetical protein